ncbi:MAG: PTS sugar transporter subunit IIB [Erysipelotrichaceae bacterium]|nr:PTS sugar transporter subunit IIB [Erysipelotrichaceae bacterium]MDY5252724.1 PTS sugar transporter subunit IIB [Erysipelotrichaceae bacterium]
MKRFYLFCNAGMSTSLLASRMQKVADANNLPVEIKAYPDSQMADIVNEFNPEVILLGPQVKHLYEKVNERYGSSHVVSVIDSVDYGNVDGERVLKKALKLYKERNN